MSKKTLMAMAVSGALTCSAGAFAGLGTEHTAYDDAFVATAPIEIGDGMLASIGDEELDGFAAVEDGAAVGATSSAGGSGTVAFSSDGHANASTSARVSEASTLADEAYLVPAPLAHNDGTRYWKVEVSPSNAGDLARLRTENMYVMTPIDDAIVDPVVALTSDPGDVVAALNETQDTSDATL